MCHLNICGYICNKQKINQAHRPLQRKFHQLFSQEQQNLSSFPPAQDDLQNYYLVISRSSGIYIYIYIYIYICIYTKIKKPKTGCVKYKYIYIYIYIQKLKSQKQDVLDVLNIKETFLILTNISVVLHNLQCK